MSVKTEEGNNLKVSVDINVKAEETSQNNTEVVETQPTEPAKKTFNIRKKRHGLYDWFAMPTQDVIDCFATLKGAQKVGEGDQQFVFVPGERDNRVVLVAHADTVWDDDPVDVGYSKGAFYSKNKHIGIGADDRAGVAMLWQLRNMGHSLLIPNAEEKHGIGSRFLMNHDDWAKTINGHQFAIQMDRMNAKDMAFYSVGSSNFKDWCEKQFKDYKRCSGSYTDICELCDPMCGMNISIGYYNQHHPEERLVEAEWQNTLNLLRKVLAKKDLPRFEQDPKPVYNPSNYHSNYSSYTPPNYALPMSRTEYNSMDDYYNRERRAVALTQANKNYNGKCDDIVVCIHCEGVMDVVECRNNHNKCIFCKEDFNNAQ